MPQHIDRRKQPHNTIKAIEHAFKEIKWDVKEIASHKFISPKGKWANESYGYILKIPREMSYIRKLWVGYLNHKRLQPPGIYAGINPILVGKDSPTPKETGYSLAPEGFNAWILIKQVIHQKEIERLENDYGKTELKKKVKEILLKTYPFNIK